MDWPTPTPPLFPYTTLFRSQPGGAKRGQDAKQYGNQQSAGVDQRHHRDLQVSRNLVEVIHFRIEDLLAGAVRQPIGDFIEIDRKSTRLNSSHTVISYAVFCL